MLALGPNILGALITQSQFGGYNPTTQAISTGIEPELDAAANVFAQSQPIVTVPNATCFFSPDNAGWSAIQQAQASSATTVLAVNFDPGCYAQNARQFVIKTSTGAYSGGLPYFIFVRTKNISDPAIVTIP